MTIEKMIRQEGSISSQHYSFGLLIGLHLFPGVLLFLGMILFSQQLIHGITGI